MTCSRLCTSAVSRRKLVVFVAGANGDDAVRRDGWHGPVCVAESDIRSNRHAGVRVPNRAGGGVGDEQLVRWWDVPDLEAERVEAADDPIERILQADPAERAPGVKVEPFVDRLVDDDLPRASGLAGIKYVNRHTSVTGVGFAWPAWSRRAVNARSLAEEDDRPTTAPSRCHSL
jgi:hypothetical protein